MVNVDEAIIAKYEYCGEHFEILVDADLAAEYQNPDSSDVAIEDLLAVEEIFKDSKKGDKASDESMNKIFETTDPIEVSKIILEKGTVQLTAEQKRHMQADKRKLVINKISRETLFIVIFFYQVNKCRHIDGVIGRKQFFNSLFQLTDFPNAFLRNNNLFGYCTLFVLGNMQTEN